MSDVLSCYRCGASLTELTPPISRQDQCPDCFNYLHVCKMCVYFDADVPRQCREDDAEEVIDKEKLNFCDWYVASANAFDAGRADEATRAQKQLDALFGDGSQDDAPADDALQAAEDLFRK